MDRRTFLTVIAGGVKKPPIEFTDDFTRDNGAVANNWVGTTWTISGNTLINTPNLSADLATDGDLENWTNPTTPASWTPVLAGTTSVNKEDSNIQGGTYALRIDVDASNSTGNIYQDIAAIGQNTWAIVEGYVNALAANKGAYFQIGNNPRSPYFLPGTSYKKYRSSQRSQNTGNDRRVTIVQRSGTSSSIFIDTVRVYSMTESELLCTRPVYPTADYILKLKIDAIESGLHTGIAFCVDDPSNPQNYIAAVLDGATLAIKVFTSGVYSLLTTAVTHSFTTEDELTVVKRDGSLRIYINDVAQTVVLTIPSTHKDNLYAGIFSTAAENTIINWEETVRPIGGSISFLAPFFNGIDGAVFPIGDSITAGGTDEVNGTGYPIILTSSIASITNAYWRESPLRYAVGGYTVALCKNGIDAFLLSAQGTPDHVLIYLGANDCLSMPDETTFKSNFLYIANAINTKYPNCKIYYSPSYRPGYNDELYVLWGWMELSVSGVSNCYKGFDSIEIFKDHVAEWLPDGVHPNHAGYIVLASAWQTLIGY